VNSLFLNFLQLVSDVDCRQQIIHLGRRFFLHARRDVRVGVEGKGDVGVLEDFLHDLGVHALLEHESRGGMAQVMESDIWQSRLLQEALVVLEHIALMPRGA
jgi:hypothetical protein